nr:MAG TPA: type I neck protein [Caudoviricetes sp.]DAQ62814.1 MAG TPA: type I neck protein [Caudoviricetes sp.]
MGQAVKINIAGLEVMKKNLENIQKNQAEIMASLVKSLGALLLRKVIFRTPVGDYSHLTQTTKLVDGKWKKVPANRKVDGNLRRNWTIGQVFKNGNIYSVEVINPTHYASYVEYGHRQTPGRFVPVLGKKLKRAWVPGRFMLTISENEIKENMDAILEKKLDSILKKVFGNAK